MSATTAASTPMRRTPGRVPVVAVALLVLGAAVVGTVFGGTYHSSRAQRVERPGTIAAVGIRLELPSDWRRGGATTLPGFSRPLSLNQVGTGLRAAVELLPASTPTLLPKSLRATEAPTAVQLSGGRRASRYRVTFSDDTPGVVLAAATTRGIATVACIDATSAQDLRSCTALAAGVTVPDSRWITASDQAAFFSGLPAAVSELTNAREDGFRARRAAGGSAAQASAAERLARAHTAAATALGLVGDTSKGLPKELTGALTTTASAYAALARAARERSSVAYLRATDAVSQAESGLRREMAGVGAAMRAATRTGASAGTPLTTSLRPPTASPAGTEPKPVAGVAHAEPPSPSDVKPALLLLVLFMILAIGVSWRAIGRALRP